MNMIGGWVHILLFQCVGEVISQSLLPTLPGPVIGLVCLLAWLGLRGGASASLVGVADMFSRYLGLLFVPAAVGVVMYLPQLRDQGGWVLLALALSTVLTMAAVALFLKLWSNWRAGS